MVAVRSVLRMDDTGVVVRKCSGHGHGLDDTARVVVVESVVDMGSDDACVSEKCVWLSV